MLQFITDLDAELHLIFLQAILSISALLLAMSQQTEEKACTPCECKLQNLDAIQILDLTGCSLTNASGGIFNNTKLKILKGLKVNQLPHNLFSGLPWLRQVQLTSDDEEIPSDLFAGLNLHQIELTVTHARHLPHTLFSHDSALSTALKKVTIKGDLLNSLHEGLFQSLINIQDISLYLNMHTLPVGIFQAETTDSMEKRHLKQILIDGVHSIPAGIFHDLCFLDQLTIHGLKTTLPRTFTQGLSLLTHLDLSENDIKKIEKSWFRDLLLRKLSLAQNNLTAIHDELHYLDQVKLLNLSGNQLTTVHPEAFYTFRQELTKIDLSYNKISNLPGTIFSDAFNLLALHLDHNDLSEMDPVMFKEMLPLQSLYLEFNSIKSLKYEHFTNLQDLVHLNMSYNNISQIGDATFHDLIMLKVLDISHNQIETIPDNLFAEIELLEQVYFQGNPLNCECGVDLLLRIADHGYQYVEVLAECGKPVHYAGMSVLSLERNLCPHGTPQTFLHFSEPTDFETPTSTKASILMDTTTGPIAPKSIKSTDSNVPSGMTTGMFTDPGSSTDITTEKSAEPDTPADIITEKSTEPGSHTDVMIEKSTEPGLLTDITTKESAEPGLPTDVATDTSTEPGSPTDITTEKSTGPGSSTNITGKESTELSPSTGITTGKSAEAALPTDITIEKSTEPGSPRDITIEKSTDPGSPTDITTEKSTEPGTHSDISTELNTPTHMTSGDSTMPRMPTGMLDDSVEPSTSSDTFSSAESSTRTKVITGVTAGPSTLIDIFTWLYTRKINGVTQPSVLTEIITRLSTEQRTSEIGKKMSKLRNVTSHFPGAGITGGASFDSMVTVSAKQVFASRDPHVFHGTTKGASTKNRASRPYIWLSPSEVSTMPDLSTDSKTLANVGTPRQASDVSPELKTWHSIVHIALPVVTILGCLVILALVLWIGTSACATGQGYVLKTGRSYRIV